MSTKKKWNLSDMEATLVKDTEARITEGFAAPSAPSGFATGSPAPSAPSGFAAGAPAAGTPASAQVPSASTEGPTKGVQTYVPLPIYRRLSDVKLQRHETIAALVAEAVAFWLDAKYPEQ